MHKLIWCIRSAIQYQRSTGFQLGWKASWYYASGAYDNAVGCGDIEDMSPEEWTLEEISCWTE
jgi:hypothetical protein